ncbi:MAG: hypothetical protein ACRD5J_11435 [Nitrososphaeraceae archaeon]
MNQIEIQEIRNERTLDKARLIAAAKRVRRSECNRNIWLVGSGNPATPRRFYKVMYDEDLDCFECDCKAFEFSSDNTCKHLVDCCIIAKEVA